MTDPFDEIANDRNPEILAFFGPRIEKLDGEPRILAQALET